MQSGGLVKTLAFPWMQHLLSHHFATTQTPYNTSFLVLIWQSFAHLLKVSLAIIFSRHPSLPYFCLSQLVCFGYSSWSFHKYLCFCLPYNIIIQYCIHLLAYLSYQRTPNLSFNSGLSVLNTVPGRLGVKEIL